MRSGVVFCASVLVVLTNGNLLTGCAWRVTKRSIGLIVLATIILMAVVIVNKHFHFNISISYLKYVDSCIELNSHK